MSKKRSKSAPAKPAAVSPGDLNQAAANLDTHEPAPSGALPQQVEQPQAAGQALPEQPAVAPPPVSAKKSPAKSTSSRNGQQGAVSNAASSKPPESQPARAPSASTPPTPAEPQAASARAAQSESGQSGADIRGVLIQLAGARLLLPNATIAEVLSYAPPEPVDAAPGWLLGKMRWRGWQLPLVAFAELAGLGKEPAGLGSKVVVLKALGGNAQAPYFAILSQGFPRLVTVSQEGLAPDPDESELPKGVHSRVLLSQDAAFVPDLHAVEVLIGQALAQAA